ncbi:unnamed protein product [Brassicogethes aeneus]|uniref:Far11/STRP C-terminal domain-containing protein n=1 Tax=Brassicogethes aeneus TaxID=1431903 RepID=A0A9P0FEC8_BRAAE|nr:unnamed protein product [Brassicogethes aeneus]
MQYCFSLESVEQVYVTIFPDFEYADTDTFENEIAEFYSYSEVMEFREYLELYDKEVGESWKNMDEDRRKSCVMKILNNLDLNDAAVRLNNAKIILYIAQGCWNEVDCVEEQIFWQRKNCFLLQKLGVFNAFVELFEIQSKNGNKDLYGNMQDSTGFRVIFGVMFTIIEVVREEKNSEDLEYKDDVEDFLNEIDSIGTNLITKLIVCCTSYNCYFKSEVPLKKTLLVLWKFILLFLGNTDDINKSKKMKMEENGLKYMESSEEVLEKHKYKEKILWEPKVHQEEIEKYINCSRFKYFNFTLLNDQDTLVGLPPNIIESIKTMKKHAYIPLTKIHIKEEMESTKTDLVYEAMLPHFRELTYLFSNLLKCIVTDSDVNIQNETMPVCVVMRPVYIQGFAVNIARHKEIILKAVSGLSLLLLRHFKTNHVYQFECMAMNMMMVGFINNIFMYLRNDIETLMQTNYFIKRLEFPYCIIGGPPKYDSNTTVGCSYLYYSWRNMFVCTNLLRIQNKITKNKPMRIHLLLQTGLKSLQNVLEIKNPLIELYTLKLIKMVAKYMGKKWRLSNLKTISKIYNKVRHKICDNWLYLTDFDIKNKLDKNASEFKLQQEIDKYNMQFYALGDVETSKRSLNFITKDFEKKYEEFLKTEVYENTYDWNEILGGYL